MATREATKRRRIHVQEEEEQVSSSGGDMRSENEEEGSMSDAMRMFMSIFGTDNSAFGAEENAHITICTLMKDPETHDWDMEMAPMKNLAESEKVKVLECGLKLQDAKEFAKNKLRRDGIFEPDPMLADLGILKDIDPNALSMEEYEEKVGEFMHEFLTNGDEGFVPKEESLYSKWVKTLDGYPIFFECPWEEGKPVTSETIMEKSHIMLPKVSGLMADLLCNSMLTAVHAHMGGGTSIGNKICFRILRRSERAARHARESKYQLALGELWGILLFTVRMELIWAMDNELEAEQWDQMLSCFSKAWNVIFAQTDAVLGWNAAARSRSITSLKSFAKDLNDLDLDSKLKIKFK